ncbi:MAG: hypothetical protein N2745_08435 [Syntrophorhabdaceae bacterium]|nr:hypothetical protein [Syntrophorhabdaceae bacterium]
MRYQRIYSQIWHDEKFNSLSEDAKYLFLYLLTSPHSNALGLYVLPLQYICADLNWDMKRLGKPFKELLGKRLINYDEKVKLVCIINHLKHNPIDNENQAKNAIKIVVNLPKSPIFSDILEQLQKPFHKPLLERLQERIPNPETETETVSETVREREEGGCGGKQNDPQPDPHDDDYDGRVNSASLSPFFEEKDFKKPKKRYLDSVFLTDDEYQRLQEVLGQKSLEVGIEKLDYSITVKGGKYKDHYKTLLNWHRRGFLGGSSGNGNNAEHSGGRRPEEPDIIDRALRGEL